MSKLSSEDIFNVALRVCYIYEYLIHYTTA